MTYRERLWPAPWLYVATGLVMPASFLVFMPINWGVGIAVAVVLYAGCLVALFVGSPTLIVDSEGIRAGRARLPFSAVGEVTGYRGAEASLERGQRLDARAWLLIRGWIDPVVTIQVQDDRDPVPYWVISTRNPEALVAAVESARSPR